MAYLINDPDSIKPYLEDSAHYPGGSSKGVYCPSDETEIADILKQHHASGLPLLVQGARTSLTGGATPMGETVLSLEKLDRILFLQKENDGNGTAVCQPYVRLRDLKEQAAKKGLFYPPIPTYDLATLGGTVATCAAGASTFKYGTTRDWVTGLRVVLVNGEILQIKRGECRANAQGLFKTKTASGKPFEFQAPTAYQTPPDLKKVSCGYFAAPGMDLIDLFIGSEGTLGVVTEINVTLIPLPPSVLSGIAFFNSEKKAFEFAAKGREISQQTWKTKNPNGLDFRAMELLDEASLELLRESGKAGSLKIPLPENAKAAIFFEMESSKKLTDTEVMEKLESFFEEVQSGGSGRQPEDELETLFQLLHRGGVLNLDELVLALPEDEEMLERLHQIREAVPQLLNEKVSRLKAKDERVTKVAADVVVPFERVPEMIQAFRSSARQANLKPVIFGHISDGNLHPNILLEDPKEVSKGMDCLRKGLEQVLVLGGAPMAEHGVGRNRLKQEFLKKFYGQKAIEQMVQIKQALDPRGILSPGVLFPKEPIKKETVRSSVKEGFIVHDVGDEEGRLWHFSLKSLTKAQNFVNHFLARHLKYCPAARDLMKKLNAIGHKTSGYLTDYIAVPFSAERMRELKRRGFVRDAHPHQIVFRHIEGIFPSFIINEPLHGQIDPAILNEEVPVEYEFDEEDIWVPLDEVWKHLPTLESTFEELAAAPFPYLLDEEIPQLEVAWRVGDLRRFGFSKDEIQGGPLYRCAPMPKTNEHEPRFVLVERQIGVYNGFDTIHSPPQLSFFFKCRYRFAKIFYSFFYEVFIYLFGMERLTGFLCLWVGPVWTRHILNEVHDAEWFRNCPKGKKDKENVEAILGEGGWKIFVDHRTLRRSLLPHLSLLDRVLSFVGLGPKKAMNQNEVCYRILQKLGMEKHEEYVPGADADWKARVMRDRDLKKRYTRSQLAYFLDEALPGRRGNIATFAAFWGASTGWPMLDFLLSLCRIDFGPDPWFFHHIAIEGHFDDIAKAVQTPTDDHIHFVTPEQKIKNAGEVGFLDRFSFMSFLRQVFSKEVRPVPRRRLKALYLSGRLTRAEYEKYLNAEENKRTKVEGPHIELIDRGSGIPWFNQVRITQAIETSSEVKVEYKEGMNKDLVEPWRIRLKTVLNK